MSHATKHSKQLRLKAQEFLANRNNNDILVEIIKHFDAGNDVLSCLLSLELIFGTLLKDKNMYIEVIPLKPVEKTYENEYKLWLGSAYNECFDKIVNCIDSSSSKIQNQGLTTAMVLLSNEGKYPLETRPNKQIYIPLSKLKLILTKLLSHESDKSHVIKKFTEYLTYNDILFATWKLLPSLTQKMSNPSEVYVTNYFNLLENLRVYKNDDDKLLCRENEETIFHFDDGVTKKVLNKIWNCVMQWEHSRATHRQLLVILLERVMPHLEKPLLLTDFLMDTMDVGGAVSLLALQGIFTLVQTHNLDYPDIFTKLYSMFEPEIFHTKYKARLFYLSDVFLSSTHLPENLVAAFVKRMARLALIAPPEDIIIICMFIGNLILRHPGLKCLLNRVLESHPNVDPYVMDERDPLKSNAINSSLWEIETLKHHMLPSVAKAAAFIDEPLPSVEWDITKQLDVTSEDLFDKEIRKFGKLVALAFEKPKGMSLSRGEKVFHYWSV